MWEKVGKSRFEVGGTYNLLCKSTPNLVTEGLWSENILWLCHALSVYLLNFREMGLKYLRAGLHHGPWSRTMEDGLSSWFDLLVQLPWSDFLKHLFTKFLVPLTRCNLNVDQEEWPCTKKQMCCYIHTFKNGSFEKIKIKFDHYFVFSCFHLLFSQKNLILWHPIYFWWGLEWE